MNEEHFAVVDRSPVPAPVTRKTEIVGGFQDVLDEFSTVLRDEWRGMIIGAGLVLLIVVAVILTGSSA